MLAGRLRDEGGGDESGVSNGWRQGCGKVERAAERSLCALDWGGGGVTLRLAELSTAAAPSWRAAAKEREREAQSRGRKESEVALA